MPSTMFWVGGSGSQSWSNTANWSGAAVPANGDTVWIEDLISDIDSGLAQGAVTLAALYRRGGTGTIGVDGDAGASLRINTAIYQALESFAGGVPQPGGPSLEKYDFGAATAAACRVDATGSGVGSRAACQIKGGASGTTLVVTGGQVDFNVVPGQTGLVSAPQVTGGVLTLGPGVTVSGTTTIGDAGEGSTPTLVTYCAVGAFDLQAGTWYANGEVTVGAGTVNGAAFWNNRKSSGDTFTGAVVVDAGGVLDFRGNPGAALFTSAPTLLEGAAVYAYKDQIKLTGPAAMQMVLYKCEADKVTIKTGQGYTLTFT